MFVTLIFGSSWYLYCMCAISTKLHIMLPCVSVYTIFWFNIIFLWKLFLQNFGVLECVFVTTTPGSNSMRVLAKPFSSNKPQWMLTFYFLSKALWPKGDLTFCSDRVHKHFHNHWRKRQKMASSSKSLKDAQRCRGVSTILQWVT